MTGKNSRGQFKSSCFQGKEDETRRLVDSGHIVNGGSKTGIPVLLLEFQSFPSHHTFLTGKEFSDEAKLIFPFQQYFMAMRIKLMSETKD